MITNLIIWFCVAVISYTLHEIPHIWSTSTTYRLRIYWMKHGQWWTDASPRDNDWFQNLTGWNTFRDAYHFFGNLPRIHLSILVIVHYSSEVNLLTGLGLGLFTFVLWAVLRELLMKILVKKI
jgi:hypothetical protein